MAMDVLPDREQLNTEEQMDTEDDEPKRFEDGPLECQLFSWDGWDGDHECMTFYDPILKVQIGKFPAGTKFDFATILFDKGVLQLGNHGPEQTDGHHKFRETVYTAEYNLKLTVAETLTE